MPAGVGVPDDMNEGLVMPAQDVGKPLEFCAGSFTDLGAVKFKYPLIAEIDPETVVFHTFNPQAISGEVCLYP